MKSRKDYLEQIIESMHAIKRKFAAHHLSKNKKKDHITASQWAVLSVVSKNKNLTITQLAQMLGVSTSAATQLVNELISKDYLERKDNPDDRRALSLAMSSSCKSKLGKIKQARMNHFKDIFDALTDKELEQYAKINQKIAKHVLNKFAE